MRTTIGEAPRALEPHVLESVDSCRAAPKYPGFGRKSPSAVWLLPRALRARRCWRRRQGCGAHPESRPEPWASRVALPHALRISATFGNQCDFRKPDRAAAGVCRGLASALHAAGGLVGNPVLGLLPGLRSWPARQPVRQRDARSCGLVRQPAWQHVRLAGLSQARRRGLAKFAFVMAAKRLVIAKYEREVREGDERI